MKLNRLTGHSMDTSNLLYRRGLVPSLYQRSFSARGLQQRLDERHITLQMTDAAREHLATWVTIPITVPDH